MQKIMIDFADISIGLLAQTSGGNFNLFDLLLIVLVGVGVHRGKTNGMSGEHMELFRWICAVVVAGLLNGIVGKVFSDLFKISLMWGQVLGYIILMSAVVLVFAILLSKGISQIWDADFFGKGEYYLGMIAGAVRYFCFILVFLSFLNARTYTLQQVEADRRWQIEELGSTLVPTMSIMNYSVFTSSYSGGKIREAFRWILINPASSYRPTGGETMGQQRTRTLDEVTK